MADLLFDWLGFNCFAYVELDRDLQVWSNPNKSNRRSRDTSPYEVSKCSLLNLINYVQQFGQCRRKLKTSSYCDVYFHINWTYLLQLNRCVCFKYVKTQVLTQIQVLTLALTQVLTGHRYLLQLDRCVCIKQVKTQVLTGHRGTYFS